MNSILNLHSVKAFSKPGIEHALFDFYRRLHSQEPANIPLQQELLSDLQPFLEEEDIQSCEDKLSLSEMTKALNGFPAGKTPVQTAYLKNSTLNFGES